MFFIITVCVALFFLVLLGFLLRKEKILLVVCILSYSFSTVIAMTEPFKIPTGSMLPTIAIGDQVLSSRYIYHFTPPSRGDIAIFTSPQNTKQVLIRRVIALEGDKVEIKAKNLYVNGKLLSESYILPTKSKSMHPSRGPRDFFGPITVPENHVFMLGDNRDNSLDSRFFGTVDQKTLQGKAEIIYWSKDHDEDKTRWNRIGNLLK